MHSIIKINLRKLMAARSLLFDQYIAAITSITKSKYFIIFCVVISETVGLANGLRFFSYVNKARRWGHMSTLQ